jgi:hypothetical protein
MTTLISTLSIDWGGIFGDNLSKVISFVPKLLIFLVVLFIGWIIAKAVSKLLGKVLEKVGFTKLLNKAGADDALASADIRPIELLVKLAYYFILLIALQAAFSISGVSGPVGDIVNQIIGWLPKVFVAIVIVVIAGAVANAVKDILASSLGGVSYGALLSKVASGFIIALGIIAALNYVGIGTTVTLPVLVAVLATVGGILVVGVGGGLIGPMSRRWDGWLDQLSADTKGNGTRAAGSSTVSPGVAPQTPPTNPPAPPQV